MKRSLSFSGRREVFLLVAGTSLIAGTYGLVRLAYGLFLPDIQASLGLGSAAAGYVSSGASVAYCTGALFGLVAGGHPRRLVVGALGTASVGAAAMALAPTTALFVPAAIVSSMGAGLASPGMIGVVERNVPQQRTDRAQAVVNCGTGPGLVGAGLLALLLLPDWRLGFLVSAALTAVAGVAVLVLDRAPRDAGDAAGSAGAPGADEPAGAWLLRLRTPATAAVLLGVSSAAVWTYGRTLLVDEGAGATASTLAWMAVGVGGTATVLTARTQARLTPQRAWTITTAVVSASVVTLGLGAHLLPLALVACLAFGWSFVAATSALIVWAARTVPHRAVAGSATLFVAMVLGQAAGSSVAGTIADHQGLPLAFVVAAAATVLAAACGRRPGAAARPARRPVPSVTGGTGPGSP